MKTRRIYGVKSALNIFYLVFLFLDVGCSNSEDNNTSVLRFRLPTIQKSQLDALNTSTVQSCYIIDVQGEGLDSTSQQECDPEYGSLHGVFRAGQDIELFVPRGKKRELSLYYYESNEGCTYFSRLKKISQYGSTNVHRLALKKDIDLFQEVVDIVLPIDRPDSSNTLETLYSMPEKCRLNTKKPNSRVRLARLAVGAGTSTLSNRGRIFLRVGDKSVFDENKNENSILVPVGLGETQ